MRAVPFFRSLASLLRRRRRAAAYANPVMAPFAARTPLETLLIDEDLYLAERAVIRPRADVPDRAGRRARR